MLERVINEYLAQQRAEQNRPHNKFRVSDAGRCHLMRYWKRQGKPATDEPDERTYRVFEVGHVFHRWIQDVLEKTNGITVLKEIPVEDEDRIGHIDAVVGFADRVILYDFKTVHSRKFHHNRKEGSDDRDIHYQMQAVTYATMLRNQKKVDEIRIAYISKDDLCIEEMVVSIPKVICAVVADWELLLRMWEKQVEPVPSPMIWECKYCIYKSCCKHALK